MEICENDMSIAREGFNLWLLNDLDAYKLEDFARKHGKSIDELMYLINKWYERKVEPCPTLEERQRKKDTILRVNAKKRASIAKECFDYYLANDLSDGSYVHLADKYNLSDITIRGYVRSYIGGQYADLGVSISKEDMEKYQELLSAKKQRTENKMQARKEIVLLRVGKLAFETFLATDGNHDELVKLAYDNFVSEKNIMKALQDYRNRVVAPKPDENEQLQYAEIVERKKPCYKIVFKLLDAEVSELDKLISGYKKGDLLKRIKLFKEQAKCYRKYQKELETLHGIVMDLPDNEKSYQEVLKETTANKWISNLTDMLTEFLSSTYYSVGVILDKYSINKYTFDSNMAKYVPLDETLNALYQRYLVVAPERLNRFAALVSKVQEKMDAKAQYNIVDLVLDIDTSLEDFKKTLYLSGRTMVAITRFAQKMNFIINSVSKIEMDDEQINALSYTYNGISMTSSIKTYIKKFLTEHGLPVTEKNFYVCFEKYVNGELGFAYQII